MQHQASPIYPPYAFLSSYSYRSIDFLKSILTKYLIIKEIKLMSSRSPSQQRTHHLPGLLNCQKRLKTFKH